MKKIISLLIAVMMTVALMPAFSVSAAGAVQDVTSVISSTGTYKYAANANTTSGSDFTEMPEITAIGNVSTGTTFYNATVAATEFADGESLSSRLADGFYFSEGEVAYVASYGTSERAQIPTGGSAGALAPAQGTNKMVKFTEAGQGVKFSWTTPQDVARLHIWAWPADAIKTYEIYVNVDGQMKKVLEGSLDYDISSAPSSLAASFYGINLPATYNTTELQFVIKELNEDVYITEVVPRSTIDIDLTSVNPRGATSLGVTEMSSKSPSIYIGEMMLGNFNGTVRSNKDESKCYYPNVFTVDSNILYFVNNGGRTYNIAAYNWDFDSTNHNAFYAVDFGETKQTINRVTNATSNATGITEVKLYYTNDASVFAALKTSGHTSVDGWTLAGTVERKGINHHTYHVADFDTTAQARYWMVRLEGASASGSMYQSLGMYNRVLPEEFGAMTDEEVVDLDIAKIEEDVKTVENNTLFPKTGANGSTIIVESDNAVVTVEEDGNNWKIATGRATAETKANVTVTAQFGNATKTKVYEVIVTPIPEFTDGNTGLLNDGFRLVYDEYWSNTPSGADKTFTNYDDPKPYKRTDKFVKFDIAGSGIEWNYGEAQTVKRLDLWVWPAYAMGDYEVQKKVDGTWVKVQEGTLNPNNQPLGAMDGNSTNTYWNSVVLTETLTAQDIRFVIKSFTNSSVGAYIAEADVKDSNLINLTAYNSTDNNDGKAFSIYTNACKATTASGVVASGTADHYRTWEGNITKQDDGSMYYAVRFPGSAHKINRIGFQVQSNTGSLNKFEIWCSSEDAAFDDTTDTTKWTKVLDVNGEFAYTYTDNGLTIDIPNAPAAACWMIKVVDETEGAQIAGPIRMYELAENEISNTAFSGSSNKAGKLAFNIDKVKNLTSGKVNVYFAAYEGDNLKYISSVMDVTLDASQNIVLYTMPSSIDIETMKIKAFVLTDALVPLTLPAEFIK